MGNCCSNNKGDDSAPNFSHKEKKKIIQNDYKLQPDDLDIHSPGVDKASSVSQMNQIHSLVEEVFNK